MPGEVAVQAAAHRARQRPGGGRRQQHAGLVRQHAVQGPGPQQAHENERRKRCARLLHLASYVKDTSAGVLADCFVSLSLRQTSLSFTFKSLGHFVAVSCGQGVNCSSAVKAASDLIHQTSKPCACAGAPGAPQMTEEDVMKELMAGTKVAKGKVRRKKGVTRGLTALAELRA